MYREGSTSIRTASITTHKMRIHVYQQKKHVGPKVFFLLRLKCVLSVCLVCVFTVQIVYPHTKIHKAPDLRMTLESKIPHTNNTKEKQNNTMALIVSTIVMERLRHFLSP